MPTPFRLTPEQFARLHKQHPADRAVDLEILANRHHYANFPALGVWRSLDGVPQLRAWEANKTALIAEAEAEYARCEAGMECAA